MNVLRFLVFLFFLAAGCADQTAGGPLPTPPAAQDDTPDAPAAPPPAVASDAAPPPPPPPAAACASTFGTAITPSFGRLDGVVRAVIVPGDAHCHSDRHHVIVQIDAAGAAYEIYVNVDSTLAADPEVRFATRSAALVGPPWSAGWHVSPAYVDYASTLATHSSALAASPESELASKIASLVPIGAHVSAFADGFSEGTGAHKVHRNGAGQDGALVVDADASPKWLLFAFAEDVF